VYNFLITFYKKYTPQKIWNQKFLGLLAPGTAYTQRTFQNFAAKPDMIILHIGKHNIIFHKGTITNRYTPIQFQFYTSREH